MILIDTEQLLAAFDEYIAKYKRQMKIDAEYEEYWQAARREIKLEGLAMGKAFVEAAIELSQPVEGS